MTTKKAPQLVTRWGNAKVGAALHQVRDESGRASDQRILHAGQNPDVVG
jgi:hypothetical protein